MFGRIQHARHSTTTTTTMATQRYRTGRRKVAASAAVRWAFQHVHNIMSVGIYVRTHTKTFASTRRMRSRTAVHSTHSQRTAQTRSHTQIHTLVRSMCGWRRRGARELFYAFHTLTARLYVRATYVQCRRASRECHANATSELCRGVEAVTFQLGRTNFVGALRCDRSILVMRYC